MRRPSSITEARLARPRLPRHLRRHRLLRRLQDGLAERTTLLVSAGAGYGKTTLLASLADVAGMPTLWYSLTEEDAELAVFLTHLSTALRRESLRYARATTTFLREGQLPPRAGATAAGVFLNDLSRIRQPLAIVLDDLHLVGASAEVNRFLSIVIEGNRSPVRFVIATRSEPPLPLGRLRARGEILEIGPEDLAFTPEEFRALFAEVYGRELPEADLQRVVEFTAGWIAAIQLALRDPRGEMTLRLAEALQRARASHSHLHDYLAGEVVAVQSPDLRRFLLLSAQLEELDPEVLAAALPDMDVAAQLERLRRRHLVQPYEGTRGPVYRFHALLLEFMRRRATAELPAGEIDAFHHAVARLLLARGDTAGAARHLAACADVEPLVELLRREGLALIDQGHYHSVRAWLDGLPEPRLAREPELRLRRGDALYYLGDWPAAELDYERARQSFRPRGDLAGEGWATLGLARLWNLGGRAEESAAAGMATLAALGTGAGPPDTELEIRLRQVVSAAHFYVGRYAEALGILATLEPLVAGNADRQSALWNNRAVIQASLGRYADAVAAFERGLRFPGARASHRAPLHLTNLALLLNELGDAERARPLLDEALRRARQSHNRSQTLSALLGQAHLAHRLGDDARCLEYLQEAEQLNDGPNLPLIRADALALRGRLLLAGGQYDAARAAVREALNAYGRESRDANWLLYRAQAAVIDLEAGLAARAFSELTTLQGESEKLEAQFPRALILLHRGEAARRLERPEALGALAEAVRLGHALGFDSFLLSEWRRNPAPFEHLMRAGEALEELRVLLTRSGAASEDLFVPLIGAADLPEAAVVMILSLCEEAGGPEAHRRLRAASWGEAAAHRAHVRRALGALARRVPELAPTTREATPTVVLETLGNLVIRGPAGPLAPEAWTSQRALSIFVYLALRGSRGAARDRLMDLFWPGGQSRRAAQNFHPTLSYARRALRGVIEGPVFVTQNGIYRLDPEIPLTVDARLFETRLADARAATGETARLRHLDEALALYRGDFLEGRYEAWTEEIRSHLAHRYEEALAEAVERHRRAGHAERALELARLLTTRDPLSEEAHVLLMRCQQGLGDRTSLRDGFEALRARLRAELGVDPLPTTTRAYEALLRGEPTEDG